MVWVLDGPVIESAPYSKAMSALTQQIGSSLSPLMATFYHRVLSHDLETEDFLRGARVVYAEGLTRWPSPHALSAMIASAAGVAPQEVAKPSVVAQPYPSVGEIREHLGELIADAYGSAGPRALWSDDPNVQQPAILDFEKALAAALDRAKMRKLVPLFALHPRCLLPPAGEMPEAVRAIRELVEHSGESGT